MNTMPMSAFELEVERCSITTAVKTINSNKKHDGRLGRRTAFQSM